MFGQTTFDNPEISMTSISCPEVAERIYEKSEIKRYATRKARKEMIDVHSQKFIKAWLDKIQYKEKIDSLQADFDLLSPEAKERVENFIDKRLRDPEGKMVPEEEIAHAVAVRLGLDTVTQNYKNACLEYDFFMRIIDQIRNI